jgi:glycogen debranching enzyme
MQPDKVVVAAGTRFIISGGSGDIDAGALHGYYAFDTRFLSSFHVTLAGKPLLATGSGQLDHSVARFYSLNPDARGLPAGTISVARDRYVAQGMHEDINLINYSTEARTVRLDLRFDVDFADVFEVRRAVFHKAGRVTLQRRPECDFTFVYRRGDFERKTQIMLTGEPTIHGRIATFEVTLAPKEQWKTCVTVMPVVDEPLPPMDCVEHIVGSPFDASSVGLVDQSVAFHPGRVRPLDQVPTLEAVDSDLISAYEATIEDLRSLRMEYLPDEPILAAGLPWFMAVFGRDSIISAIQTKLLGPELMIGTLRTLASLQATRVDAFRDSAPGKMPHEVRVGELSVLEEVPHSRYYGTVDATPLYLRLLHEAYQWTGDIELIRSLLPPARAAIEWMDNYGDLDGDGFLEYRRRSRHGLRNQGWKDSHDSIAFARGALAQGPIALAEVQGYAYDAKNRMAALLRIVGEQREAARLDTEARALRKAFNEAFWMPEEGFFALALDGSKRQVDSIASNAGHLLWSGIVHKDRAAAVVERLMAPDMFSGWGIRTLSTEMALYNPLSYHNGSIWPHDNSLIASGMASYGFHREARVIATGLVEAAARFQDHRLPELFAGYPRRDRSFPVPYPAANAPQAWACGAVIYLIETLLNVRVLADKLETTSPADRPAGLQLHGVPFRGMRLTL